MTVTYTPAPEAARIAAKLIGDYHTRLADQRIEFVFREKAKTSGGRLVGATATKITGLAAFMAREVTSEVDADPGDPFFVIEVAKDRWDALSAKQRIALVDHELCHCAVVYNEDKETWTLAIRGHDVEEFSEIVERHGLWEDDLAKFAESIKQQLNLFHAGDTE